MFCSRKSRCSRKIAWRFLSYPTHSHNSHDAAFVYFLDILCSYSLAPISYSCPNRPMATKFWNLWFQLDSNFSNVKKIKHLQLSKTPKRTFVKSVKRCLLDHSSLCKGIGQASMNTLSMCHSIVRNSFHSLWNLCILLFSVMGRRIPIRILHDVVVPVIQSVNYTLR